MNSYVNTAVGALLGTVFVLMSVSIASESLFHSENPEKEGFAIVAEEASAADAGGAAPAAAVPIAQLLTTSDDLSGDEWSGMRLQGRDDFRWSLFLLAAEAVRAL